ATPTVSPPDSGVPTGKVDFKEGAATLAADVDMNGATATFSTSSLAVGTHSITAVYKGVAGDGGSTSPPISQVVDKAGTSTALSTSVNPSNAGDQVTFTATPSVNPPGAGLPTGTVDFKE